MESLTAYLPEDRVRALASGRAIPDRAHGSALFADISGFTPLTEALTHAYGPRAGVDLLSEEINAVYAALIARVGDCGGSVIDFSGDAITCWFDDADGPAAPRAAACGLALQRTMLPFAAEVVEKPGRITLALKVAVAGGPVRRFAVGDPAIQRLDVLAGATLSRMAAGENLTRPGEVLLDAATVAALDASAQLGDLRTDPETGATFTRLHFLDPAPITLNSEHPPLAVDVLRPWVLPVIWERYLAGMGTYLTELRPAVALFLRFEGIDFDGDEQAGPQLDALICRAQAVLAAGGGTLLNITVGDKGAYFYAAFGAPIAHEDDARRAAHAALALQPIAADMGMPPFQIGLSQGTLRCGNYGGPTRHTYGVLGDHVNLAARLMSKARPGETLLSGNLQVALGDAFALEAHPPLLIKGKREPLAVFGLLGANRRRAGRLPEAAYALPMIGRDQELARITALIEQTLAGSGQVAAISGEAGIGKSRLVAEVARTAQRHGLVVYSGAGQAGGTQTPYLAWRPLFQALLDVDPDKPLRRQVRRLEGELEDRLPDRVEMLSLLGPLLELPLPENEITAALEPKARKGALEALLVDLLLQAVQEEAEAGGGLLLILEDLHWLDPMAADLLVTVARAAERLPLLLLLAYRPSGAAGLAETIATLPYATTLVLDSLDDAALEGLLRARLARLYPARSDAPPRPLLEQLFARSQGNPFYAEELLNYLHDRGVDLYDPQALEALALPDTLHRLVLARIDLLTAQEQVTLRLASVIGRRFPADWLAGFAMEPAMLQRLRGDLERLAQTELTALERPEPELTYLFKHIVTQEVTYTSLPRATRSRLHEQLAGWIEQHFAANPPLDLLAFHYDQTGNLVKRREYLRRAGDAARAAYANQAAIEYYRRLIDLLDDPSDQAAVLLLLGAVQVETGNWTAAQASYARAATAAEAADDRRRQAEALSRRGRTLQGMGDYPAARQDFNAALGLAELLDDEQERLRAENYLAGLSVDEGASEQARALLSVNLARARALHDRKTELSILVNLGNHALAAGDLAACAERYQAALHLAQQLGDRWHEALVLANLGELAARAGKLSEACELARRSVGIDRILGNYDGVALTLVNLADMACAGGDLDAAISALREALPLSRLGGGVVVTLCVLYALAQVQVQRGEQQAAAALLRLAIEHSAATEELRLQARELAQGIAAGAPALSLEAAITAAEHWLNEAGETAG